MASGELTGKIAPASWRKSTASYSRGPGRFSGMTRSGLALGSPTGRYYRWRNVALSAVVLWVHMLSATLIVTPGLLWLQRSVLWGLFLVVLALGAERLVAAVGSCRSPRARSPGSFSCSEIGEGADAGPPWSSLPLLR